MTAKEDDRFGHIYGLPILSLHEAASQWMVWNRVLADFKGDPYKIRGGAWPRDAVDPAYINRRSIRSPTTARATTSASISIPGPRAAWAR